MLSLKPVSLRSLFRAIKLKKDRFQTSVTMQANWQHRKGCMVAEISHHHTMSLVQPVLIGVLVCSPLMEQLQLHRLVDRLDYFQAILTFRCLNNVAPTCLKDLFSPRSSVCSRITRNFFRLLLPSPRSNYLKMAFSYKGACHWNSLPNGVINLNSLQSFKVTYKKLLLDIT